MQGATNAFTMYFAYLNNIAREMGIDKATALSADVVKAIGASQGMNIKKEAGGAEFDTVAAAAAARKSVLNDFGIESEPISENPDKVVLRYSKCPIYDAAQNAGLDKDAIEAQCRDGSIAYMDALTKQLNPNLNYRLRKFRTSANESCEEEIVLG